MPIEHRGPDGELLVRDPSPEIRAALDALRTLGEERVHRVLPRAGMALLGEAVSEAPVKTGFLKSQHALGPYSADRREQTLQVNASYAIARHERFPALPGYRWFVGAIARHAERVLRRLVEIEVRAASEDARRSASGTGGIAS